MVLPPSLQSSLPAGWLAFTGRELNPLDCYKRFQITFPSSFSGFVLAQGKFHFEPPSSHHPITSSARASSDGGTSMPSAFAIGILRGPNSGSGLLSGAEHELGAGV